MKKIYKLTADGKKDLEKELKELKSHRKAVTEKIAEARDFGDLSENAEYDVAREEQGIVETRISEIESILQNTEIIKSSVKSKVSLGSKVCLKYGKKEVIYTVVGPVEANPLEGRISDVSPIGKALFGKQVGDNIIISTPKGSVKYEISAIS